MGHVASPEQIRLGLCSKGVRGGQPPRLSQVNVLVGWWGDLVGDIIPPARLGKVRLMPMEQCRKEKSPPLSQDWLVQVRLAQYTYLSFFKIRCFSFCFFRNVSNVSFWLSPPNKHPQFLWHPGFLDGLGECEQRILGEAAILPASCYRAYISQYIYLFKTFCTLAMRGSLWSSTR